MRNNPLQALFDAGLIHKTPFPENSRYRGIALAVYTPPAGKPIAYLRRRFAPPPEAFADFSEHVVQEGDRLDNLAANYMGDPEQFWQLCDMNGAMRPEELTDEIGERIRIGLPQGVPGPNEAEGQ